MVKGSHEEVRSNEYGVGVKLWSKAAMGGMRRTVEVMFMCIS